MVTRVISLSSSALNTTTSNFPVLLRFLFEISTQKVVQRQAQQLQCLVDQEMQRLLAASQMIQFRARIRSSDAQRVADALMLAREADPPEDTRKRNYWEFLRSISRDCGNAIVSLCALGLGCSRIGGMRDSLRLQLSRRIRDNRADFDCKVLRDYLQKMPANRTSRTISNWILQNKTHHPNPRRPPAQPPSSTAIRTSTPSSRQLDN